MDTTPENATPLARKHMREKNSMEKPYARYHMREDQTSSLEVQKCSTVEQTPPNELRNIDFALDYRTFSKIQPQNSLKIVGGVTLSESKHNKIAIISVISSTDLA